MCSDLPSEHFLCLRLLPLLPSRLHHLHWRLHQSNCLFCPSSRPVLTDGRCLPTCNKTQFFDPTCVACNWSCSSCSGSGPSQCLVCASASQVRHAGTCVAASCQQAGICPARRRRSAIPWRNTPTAVAAPRCALAWWEILLMALRCAFIFIFIMWWWRRRSRKRRVECTKRWTAAQSFEGGGWRWRLLPFGEKLFGHCASDASAHFVSRRDGVDFGPDAPSRGGPQWVGHGQATEVTL
ncbi:hypothetical protein GGX14DRAFT_373774 [Mycena pura]|uniref:Uncharacterized protein n=1 Tax=Mycena pura TaxID=153505 RepID=A0AAD6V015_9AGAR|nr:hypothetical protein GGX14DRAFT_373774 [Mycena pura]